MTIRKKQSGTLDKTSNTTDAESDKILAGISNKAMKAEIKTSLSKLRRSALRDKFGSLPKIRPKETELSFTKRIKDKVKDFIENTKFNPVRKNLKQYERRTSTVNKYKGGMIKKKPVVKAKKKK